MPKRKSKICTCLTNCSLREVRVTRYKVPLDRSTDPSPSNKARRKAATTGLGERKITGGIWRSADLPFSPKFRRKSTTCLLTICICQKGCLPKPTGERSQRCNRQVGKRVRQVASNASANSPGVAVNSTTFSRTVPSATNAPSKKAKRSSSTVGN